MVAAMAAISGLAGALAFAGFYPCNSHDLAQEACALPSSPK